MIHNPMMHNSCINYPSILPLCRDHLQYRRKEKYKCDTKTWSPGGRKQALRKKMYFLKKCSFLFWNCKIQMKKLVLESHFNKVTDLRSIALHVFLQNNKPLLQDFCIHLLFLPASQWTYRNQVFSIFETFFVQVFKCNKCHEIRTWKTSLWDISRSYGI